MRPSAALAPRDVSITAVVLAAAAIVAWALTISWVRVADMGAMPGTMGMSLMSFVVMWGLMMSAMMLPSVAPFVLSYRATLVDHRAARLTGLALGYLLIWTAVGVLAYFVAGWFGDLASDRANVAQAVAVSTFTLVGLFQLTPLKFRCLSHCRTPLGHLIHYLGFTGRLRDVRAGASHGWFCLGCCWALMLLMIAFGVMNIGAMLGLAAVIAIEKLWRHGETFARVVGIACLVFAVLVLLEPGLAPGLDPDGVNPMQNMGM
jgi:predicted metal-binding membrane protein